MGTSKTPRKPSAPTPPRKQRTISSFFATPKPTPAKKTKPVGDQGNVNSFVGDLGEEEGEGKGAMKPAPVPRQAKARQAPQKRVLEDIQSGGDDEDLYSEPVSKRKGQTPAKRARRALNYEPEPEAEVEPESQQRHEERAETPLQLPSTPSASKGKLEPALSERTAKYRFSSNQGTMQVDDDPSDVNTKKWKEKMHEKFVEKLGKPGSMFDTHRKNGIIDGQDENTEEGEGAEEPEEEEEEGPIAKRFGKGVKAQKPTPLKGKVKKSKLTPLEQQVVDIKQKYPDTVLVVEVGYKFRFFGEDARIASQNLSIMCIPGKMRFDEHPSEANLDRFASASIPVPRLHVHVKRLVSAGYKVGIVRQRETAALKAAGENRNAPFTRELTNLYTKGTYIDDTDAMEDVSAGSGSGGAPNTGYLLCITEKPGGGTGTDEKSHVGIVAVQPATGDVIYDEFDDGFMRSEIETRLLHIAPCEFLIVGELTKATEKMVSHLAGGTTTVFGERVRVERVGRKKGGESTTMASKHVSTFYADKLKSADSPNAAEANKLLDSVMNLPDLVTVCLSAMITHLSDYGLEHVFDLTKYFTPFSARSHMLLNGNTLTSLEIYRNQTDYTTKGSLFWTLDRTKTKFGKRLLRKWVGRPLLHKEALEERIAAVEEILAGKNGKLDRIRELLSRIGSDLEKGLIRIYYGKCTRPELFQILQTMHRISHTFHKVDAPEEVGFQSRILNEAVTALPEIKESVEAYLDVFNHNSACKDDKYDFFKDEDQFELITEHKMGISAVEAELQEHLKEIAKTLKKPKATYVSVSGIEFLAEVSNDKNSLKLVPASWVKISGTKKVSRFHTPKVIKLLRERDQHKESLSVECDKAFQGFLSEISTKYQEFRDCVQSLATLDCLFSLAVVASQPNYCKPEFTAETCIEVTEGRHPMVEQLLIDAYVPNDIALYTASKRAMVVTGPNMGGKSSYVRQVALISIMAQIGSYVPATSARVGLLDAVFTRMGAFDNMMAGESTFMVELSETSDILKMATERSLVILDELGRGTSTHDGVAIAHAVLDYVVKEIGCMCLFVTHYPLLAQFGEKYKEEVMNAHMQFSEANDGSEDITFLYQIGEGVAHRSYGLNVARLAGIPKRCLETAGIKSAQLEMELKEKETIRWANAINAAIVGSDLFDPTKLLKSIEYI